MGKGCMPRRICIGGEWMLAPRPDQANETVALLRRKKFLLATTYKNLHLG